AKALLASSASSRGSQLTTLTFTQSNWFTPQAFVVKPVDNLIQDGNVSLNVYAASTSEDGSYHNLKYSDTSVSYATDGKAFALTITDNDTAGVVASVMNGNTQEGGNGFIRVVLNSQPTSNVNVTLRPSDDQFSLNDLSIGQSEQLTFTPDKAGRFSIVCDNFCGEGHDDMSATLIVTPA
ncbi:MAG: hypothetical protein WCJ22_06325, partial [Actinomycetes bacterium]